MADRMTMLDRRLNALKAYSQGKPGKRLCNELEFARRVSLARANAYDAPVSAALDAALQAASEEGEITNAAVKRIESILMPIKDACKQYTWLLAGHAHIDMNWLWPMEETVSIVLNTFRTMLNLMEEYPEFKFSQSQASTYAIVEQYDPDMLREIRARIREGRWEVTASSWVEPDHNMPSAESEIRHLLYTKRYLSSLLGVPEDELCLDFEPDTFGHNAKLPDVLTRGGVRYMYHCRGEKEESLYRWRGRTGRELLVYCDPDWYGCTGIGAETAQRLPQFCEKYGITRYLSVFGVGDHGGGPTRDDLDMLRDMMTWPIFPTMRFSTYREFFASLEAVRDTLPVLTGERNSVFSGCYTTQTRIKRGNALAERSLYGAELFGVMARCLVGAPCRPERFEDAWRRVLFNHFHDILPGSGLPETREYAMGQYQVVASATGAMSRLALSSLCGAIDTSSLAALDNGIKAVVEPSAYGIDTMQCGLINRRDALRVFHLFNTLPVARQEAVELTVWDFDGEEEMEFVLPDGTLLPHQVIDHRHAFGGANVGATTLLYVALPACGYITVALRRRAPQLPGVFPVSRPAWRREEALDMTLENERVRAVFDGMTARMKSLTDLSTGKTMALDGGFDWLEEAPDGMSAWNIGAYMSARPAGVRTYISRGAWGDVRRAFTVRVDISDRTSITYTVSLDRGSDKIVYDAVCAWREIGSDKAIPSLRFAVRLPSAPERFRSRIAGGTIDREGVALDQASQHVIAGGGVALMCDSKYGFRGLEDQMSVTLARGSVSPDQVPEMGDIPFRLALGLAQSERVEQATSLFVTPVQVVDAVSGACHGGALPMAQSIFRLDGQGLSLIGVKPTEDGDGLIAHIASDEDADATATLTFAFPVKSAALTDLTEREQGKPCDTDGNIVRAPVPAHDLIAVRVCL